MPARLPSLEPPRDAVKQPERDQKSRPGGRLPAASGSPPGSRGARGARGAFDGWEPFAITVGLVLCAALLAVPRGATPAVFPVPLIDGAEAREARLRDAALADRAEREGLPFETRAVGDGLRRLGAALAGGSGDREHLTRLLAERVQIALNAEQLDALARLQAVQARMFVRAVRDFSWQGAPPPELAALGGDFVEHARRSGWVADGACIATDDELRSLFKRRWTELLRLRAYAPFKPTLGELRRYFRFLLLHPERGTETDEHDGVATRLRYVTALARVDGEYPADLARGVLLGSLGMSAESAAALIEHLARPRGSDWNLRARNHLLFAAKDAAALSVDSVDD
jgi:hypothetical protein